MDAAKSLDKQKGPEIILSDLIESALFEGKAGNGMRHLACQGVVERLFMDIHVG